MRKPSERIEEVVWVKMGREIRLDVPRALEKVGEILDELILDHDKRIK